MKVKLKLVLTLFISWFLCSGMNLAFGFSLTEFFSFVPKSPEEMLFKKFVDQTDSVNDFDSNLDGDLKKRLNAYIDKLMKNDGGKTYKAVFEGVEGV